MRGALVAVFIATAATTAAAQQSQAAYADLVRLYRTGSYARAASELRYQSIMDLDERAVLAWARTARRDGRLEDLSAALMLHTEAIFDEASADVGRLRTSMVIRRNDRLLRALHQQFRESANSAPLLRAWYLAWETFRQGFWVKGDDPIADYLDEALAAFPDDPDLLLAAGTRQEQVSWSAVENRLRDPGERERGGETSLSEARRYFARCIAADSKNVEAHIRLGRVLTLLGDLTAAEGHLTGGAQSSERTFEYLRLLFLGDLRERQNNRDAAAAAYQKAIGLTPAAQSARIAAAQLAHELGRRDEAARAAIQAMDTPRDDQDPWWAYLRGEWWRWGYYLKQARSLVTQATTGSARR